MASEARPINNQNAKTITKEQMNPKIKATQIDQKESGQNIFWATSISAKVL